ncbi:hypothetical protein EE612_054777 [Oryza sativa]|nr:hypothetical protein EE612_054777 [Oryza sativa]
MGRSKREVAPPP